MLRRTVYKGIATVFAASKMRGKIIGIFVFFLVERYCTFRQFCLQPCFQFFPAFNAAVYHSFRRLNAEQLLLYRAQHFAAFAGKPLALAGRNICRHKAQTRAVLLQKHQKTVMLIVQKLLV